MKMHQKMNLELLNCSGCFLRYIRWILFILTTIIVSSIYYFLSIRYIAKAVTYNEALCYYWSCPPTNNLLFVIAFYLVTFIPVLFGLRFLDCKICSEYYITRLNVKRNFILAKIFCIVVLNIVNILFRLFLFILYTMTFCPHISIEIEHLLPTICLIFLTYITFNLIIFLLYSIIKNATIVFVIFSFLFLSSLYFHDSYMSSIMFWIYGLNMYHLSRNIIYGDLILLVIAITSLLVRRHDIIAREEEKSE